MEDLLRRGEGGMEEEEGDTRISSWTMDAVGMTGGVGGRREVRVEAEGRWRRDLGDSRMGDREVDREGKGTMEVTRRRHCDIACFGVLRFKRGTDRKRLRYDCSSSPSSPTSSSNPTACTS